MPTYSWEKRSMNPFRGRVQIIAVMIGIVLIIVSVCVAIFVHRAWFIQPTGDVQDQSMVTIKPGEIVSGVAMVLEEAQLIDSAFAFRVYVKLFDSPKLYPGTYTLIRDSSYQDIMAVLHEIESNVVRVTIPEGFSLADIGERIHTSIPSVTIESWNSVVGVDGSASRHPFVNESMKPKNVDLEGYLFPDTYEFSKDATAEQIANSMIDTMMRRVDTLGDPTGDAAGMSIHEVLTLASIVEKEVRTAETMKNVADIFLKRIAIGMALQSDATINYIIDGDNPSPLYSDLEVDSPYNTYKNPGLPPGPIAAPGLNALTAVFHPTHNDDYYFLTTDAGAIYYAKTYDQHLENKRRYLK